MTFERDADGDGTRVSGLLRVRRLVTNGFLVSKRVWAVGGLESHVTIATESHAGWAWGGVF